MNFIRLAGLPVLIVFAVTVATVINMNNTLLVLLQSGSLRRFLVTNDFKNMTMFIALLVYVLMHAITEVLLFLSSKKNSRYKKYIREVKNNVTQFTSLTFIALITGYIAKVNDETLFKFSGTLMTLLLLYFISCLVQISIMSFIFALSIYYTICLLFAFSSIKHFPFMYKAYMTIFLGLFNVFK